MIQWTSPYQQLIGDCNPDAPKPGQPARHETLRGGAKGLALMIVENTPPSREQSLALTALEEAVFWANAAIARNE